MSSIKRLVGDTAIYGISSILARLLNFLLTPLLTEALSKEEFGKNTDLYVYVAFGMVVLTYGMETAFFRFNEKADKQTVYDTVMKSILGTTAVFTLLFVLFHSPIVSAMRYTDYPELVYMMWTILVMEVVAAVPLARLRAQRRAKKFVFINFTRIVLNLGANYFFYLILPYYFNQGATWAVSIYNPNIGVGYVLIANLISSGYMMLMLIPEFFQIGKKFDQELWKKMLKFGYPLLLAGLPGVANELADRQFIKYLLPENIAFEQVGIYGGVYKLSIFLVLFNQAFRYAAEPFFFSEEKSHTAKDTFARIMKYFVIVMCLGLVFVQSSIDLIKHFLDAKYWEYLYFLPIILIANVFLGINTQLSIWYKLSEKTGYGLIITLVGFAFTVGLNLALIPQMGIVGAAWATLASYISMTLTSYWLGQKHYPIHYPVGRIFIYLLSSSLLGYLAYHFEGAFYWPQLLIIASFLTLIFTLEKRELSSLKNLIKKVK